MNKLPVTINFVNAHGGCIRTAGSIMEGLRLKSQKKFCPRKRCYYYRRQKNWTQRSHFDRFLDSLDVNLLLDELPSAFTGQWSWGALIHYILKGCLYLFFPFSGWIADTCFGRYKDINIGLCISLGGALFNIVAITLSYQLPFGTIKKLLMIIPLLPLYVGYCCFSANIIQFVTDQMIEIGASAGEQLSALIHWQYWAFSLGECIHTWSSEHLLIVEHCRYIFVAV